MWCKFARVCICMCVSGSQKISSTKLLNDTTRVKSFTAYERIHKQIRIMRRVFFLFAKLPRENPKLSNFSTLIHPKTLQLSSSRIWASLVAMWVDAWRRNFATFFFRIKKFLHKWSIMSDSMEVILRTSSTSFSQTLLRLKREKLTVNVVAKRSSWLSFHASLIEGSVQTYISNWKLSPYFP